MSNESEQLAWDFDGLAGASTNADDSKDERNGEPDIAIVANEGIARFPSGSEQWVAVLQATDEDALRLNRLDVSGMEADTAARLWAKVAAWVEADQIAYYIDDAPVSSDAAYDARLRCLQRLEAAFPTLDNPQSPTRRVGGTFSNDFVSVRHPSRMMSLDDVFSIEEDSDEKSAFVNYLHITNGAINQAFTFEYKKRLNESKEELLSLGIIEMRERYKSLSREIIVPFELDMELKDVVFTIPQRGDKKKLLELSILNVKQYKADRLKQAEKLNPEQRTVRLLKEIQQELHLDRLPMQIECFDNSNIQGSDPVAGCVVFVKGKPSKKDYRKYNIKTVEGPDDYASMKEVVNRRYQRAIEEKAPLPDLLITDGGKGQMSAVKEVIDELGLNIPIAGLAKDGKHRTSELLYGYPPQTIGLKQNTPLFRLLTQIQDEVHRFAITFHRDKRSKRQIASALDEIKGIGEKTKSALLKEFKSVKRIREASAEELAAVVGEAKAKIIQTYFSEK